MLKPGIKNNFKVFVINDSNHNITVIEEHSHWEFRVCNIKRNIRSLG